MRFSIPECLRFPTGSVGARPSGVSPCLALEKPVEEGGGTVGNRETSRFSRFPRAIRPVSPEKSRRLREGCLRLMPSASSIASQFWNRLRPSQRPTTAIVRIPRREERKRIPRGTEALDNGEKIGPPLKKQKGTRWRMDLRFDNPR